MSQPLADSGVLCAPGVVWGCVLLMFCLIFTDFEPGPKIVQKRSKSGPGHIKGLEIIFWVSPILFSQVLFIFHDLFRTCSAYLSMLLLRLLPSRPPHTHP